MTHARILLRADASDDGLHWPHWRFAHAREVRIDTVERVQQRFVGQGFQDAPERKKRDTPPWPIKRDGRAEARLIALACSPPPEGQATWTMQLLANKRVELEVVMVHPTQQDAESVAGMEDVLDTPERLAHEKRPLVCLDEASKHSSTR